VPCKARRASSARARARTQADKFMCTLASRKLERNTRRFLSFFGANLFLCLQRLRFSTRAFQPCPKSHNAAQSSTTQSDASVPPLRHTHLLLALLVVNHHLTIHTHTITRLPVFTHTPKRPASIPFFRAQKFRDISHSSIHTHAPSIPPHPPSPLHPSTAYTASPRHTRVSSQKKKVSVENTEDLLCAFCVKHQKRKSVDRRSKFGGQSWWPLLINNKMHEHSLIYTQRM
jgi:hypothetical protein